MFVVDVKKAKPSVTQLEPLITSGSLNAFSVQFIFNDDWEGMTKFATFRCKGKPTMEVLLDDTNTCDIPWELLVDPGPRVQVGAYGIRTGETKHVRLPTIWVNLEDISEGVLYGFESQPPSSDIYTQFIQALDAVPRPMTADELREILTAKE